MRINDKTINITLGIIAIALLCVCVGSIMRPIQFGKERATRETAVKQRLVKIRMAETKFKQANGNYCGSLDSLVAGGYMADSLMYIPYSDNRKFDLSATVLLSKAGKSIPLMECGATYEEYLNGMDKNEIDNITEEANSQGKYQGLKIGDTTTPNNNEGNWE